MKNKRVKLIALTVGVLALAGAAFGVYAEWQVRHLPPMRYYVGLRAYTAQSRLRLSDETGRLLVNHPIIFPVTNRPIPADRNLTVVFDRKSLAVQDSLNHTVFQTLLAGAGQVNVSSSFHGIVHPPGDYPYPFGASESFSFGEGVKPKTPHTYTVVISPNYKTRFL